MTPARVEYSFDSELLPDLHYHVYCEDKRRATTTAPAVDPYALAHLLPHGSGFDCDWHVTIRRDGTVCAATEYHAMDEYGGYAGYRPVRVVLSKVRHDVLHSLPTPIGAPAVNQILYKRGDVTMDVYAAGDDRDYYSDTIGEALREMVPGIGQHGAFTVDGRPAQWSQDRGGWIAVDAVDVAVE